MVDVRHKRQQPNSNRGDSGQCCPGCGSEKLTDVPGTDYLRCGTCHSLSFGCPGPAEIAILAAQIRAKRRPDWEGN